MTNHKQNRFTLKQAMISLLSLLILNNIAYGQNHKRPISEKLKTTRLHIDGFSKSKSGAV